MLGLADCSNVQGAGNPEEVIVIYPLIDHVLPIVAKPFLI